MSKAGDIEIRVWKGGFPVWCEIYYQGKVIAKLHHQELSDLVYVAKKASCEAELELRCFDEPVTGVSI